MCSSSYFLMAYNKDYGIEYYKFGKGKKIMAMISFNGDECLKEIKCPTFIIAAKGDQVFDYHDSIYVKEKV